MISSSTHQFTSRLLVADLYLNETYPMNPSSLGILALPLVFSKLPVYINSESQDLHIVKVVVDLNVECNRSHDSSRRAQ